MSELKNCPFCGRDAIRNDKKSYIGVAVSCGNKACHLSRSRIPKKGWNTRPIEDALRAENEQLRADNARMREALEAIEMHTNEYIDKGANYPEYLDEIIKTIKALKGGE